MKVNLSVKFLNVEIGSSLYQNGEGLQYQTAGSSGFDLRANEVLNLKDQSLVNLKEDKFTLKPHQRCLVKTGLFTQFSEDFEIQVRSRSGLAFKNGVFVLNSPGTIDSDYRGEIGVILYNSSESDFEIKHGDRIAQAVLCPVMKANFIFEENLESSERGSGGFGSTGV